MFCLETWHKFVTSFEYKSGYKYWLLFLTTVDKTIQNVSRQLILKDEVTSLLDKGNVEEAPSNSSTRVSSILLVPRTDNSYNYKKT